MKTFVKLLSAVLFFTISARTDLYASGHGGGGGGGTGGSGGGHGGSSSGHVSAGHASSGHVFFGGHHHHGPVFFVGGFYNPWWWYDYYPDYYYGYNPYGSAYSTPDTGQAYSPGGPSYDDLGKFWGKNLKKGASTPQDLVTFIQSDLAHASDSGRELFRGGFLKTYRNGSVILDHAFHDAAVAR